MLLLSKFHNFSTTESFEPAGKRPVGTFSSTHVSSYIGTSSEDVDDDVGRIVCGVSLVM